MNSRSSLLLFAIMFILFACRKSNDTSIASPDDVQGYDWQPDTLFTDSVSLDVDSNSMADIRFRINAVYAGSTQSGGPYYNYFAQAVALDSVVSLSPGIESTSGLPEWNCLDSGQVIGPQLTWSRAFNLRAYVVMAGSVGIWDLNTPHGYIAFKIHGSSGFNYGWIRLQASTMNIQIDAYGFNKTPNNTIRAGQSQ
jgi:hypothetical protein